MGDLHIHQEKAIKALECIYKLCEDNGITVLLLAGTCLGAVRHKGFIPWDDDIDVGIRNEEYCLFENLMKHISTDSDFIWVNNDNRKHYPRFYGKIVDTQGSPLIDVFRLVRLPKSKKCRKRLWKTRKALYKLLYRKNNNGMAENEKSLSYILSLLASLFIPEKTIVKLARWNERRYLSNASEDYINLYSVYPFEKEIINADWLQHTSEVVFEEKKYKTVGDTDAYLFHLYGNYMELPPECERIRNHDITFNVL